MKTIVFTRSTLPLEFEDGRIYEEHVTAQPMIVLRSEPRTYREKVTRFAYGI